jgi:hypothetical protein
LVSGRATVPLFDVEGFVVDLESAFALITSARLRAWYRPTSGFSHWQFCTCDGDCKRGPHTDGGHNFTPLFGVGRRDRHRRLKVHADAIRLQSPSAKLHAEGINAERKQNPGMISDKRTLEKPPCPRGRFFENYPTPATAVVQRYGCAASAERVAGVAGSLGERP